VKEPWPGRTQSTEDGGQRTKNRKIKQVPEKEQVLHYGGLENPQPKRSTWKIWSTENPQFKTKNRKFSLLRDIFLNEDYLGRTRIR
jgi:hypothetical protein